MLQRLIVIFLALVLMAACNMWSKPASGWSGATGGEQIEKLFWKDVQAKNWTEVDRRLADTFTGSGPSGTFDRNGFIKQLQTSNLSDVSLSECTVQSNGADLVVACTAHASQAAFSTLSIWQQLNKGWVMVAHAESPQAPSGK